MGREHKSLVRGRVHSGAASVVDRAENRITPRLRIPEPSMRGDADKGLELDSGERLEESGWRSR